jgi:hypothetical protein
VLAYRVGWWWRTAWAVGWRPKAYVDNCAAPEADDWARGQRLRTGAGILASASLSTDPPSDEELLAFLDVVYDARRVDA